MRNRYLWLLAGAMIPWITLLLYLTENTPYGQDLTPFGLIFTAIFVIIELSRKKIFNILPFARSHIFEVINKGIIIVDQKNNIADINPSAKAFLGVENDITGASLCSLFSDKGSFLEYLFSSELQPKELPFEPDLSRIIWLEVSQTPLTNKKGHILGRLITLSDITSRKENEEALARERILLRTLVDNLPHAVYVKDLQSRKILANKADLLNMGLENEADAIGKTDFDVFPPEVAAIFYANDQEVLSTGLPVMDKEEVIFTQEGEDRWLLTSKVPFHDKQGQMLGVLGIGRDISEWKKMQKELANSEERFRTLTETTSAAVFIFQQDKFLYVNPAGEKITGYAADEWEQMNFMDVLHPEYKHLINIKFESQNNGQQTSRRYEFKIITKDGCEKWIDFSTGETLYQGKSVTIGTCFEITERKTAQDALKRSEQRYRNIFENSNIGILQLNPLGETIGANNAFAHLIGFENASDFLQTGIFKNLFASQKDSLHFFQKIHARNSIDNFVFKANHLQGEKKWLMVNAWKNKGFEGKEYLIEGFFQDITDRKLSLEYQSEMEIARKSAETKNQFLANMSHEIRTPVTGIMGMADVLSKTPLSPLQAEYLTTIEESSQKLLEIINEILDISKIEAGKMELRPGPFILDEMLRSLKNMFEPIAHKKNLELHCNVHPDTPLWLIGDKKRIEQILMNLVSNAIKFTSQGSVSTSISSKEISQGVHELQFRIQDTGVGIPVADTEKLFHKFTQLDNSLTRHTEGTGLGLFICKELVRLMQGAIGIEKPTAQGSTFWFSIPLAVSEIRPLTGMYEPDQKKKTIPPLRILIVDDKAVNQKVLALMLRGEGCKVDVACNGFDALEKFDPLSHQLIFMDIMMPGMDGVTAMKELHKKYECTPPIIALTANAMEGDAETYLASGFNDYLAKPVSRKDLQQTLMKWSG